METMSQGQVCDFLGVSLKLLWFLVRMEGFPSPIIIKGGKNSWCAEDVRAWHSLHSDLCCSHQYQPTPNTLESVIQRVLSIEPNERGCREWPNYQTYGKVSFEGKIVKVSRLVLEWKLGRKIKSGFMALHTCDNKPCVEPEHLYERTDADNMRDRSERNQQSWDKQRSPEYREYFGQIMSEVARKPENLERFRRMASAWGKSPENVERMRRMNRSSETLARLKSPEQLEHLDRIRKLGHESRRRKREQQVDDV